MRKAIYQVICRTKYLFLGLLLIFIDVSFGQEARQYEVVELQFNGSQYKATDNPVRDIELVTKWVHESGEPSYKIYGFYDGDGKGGASGDVFKVRFCPTKPGKWMLAEVTSNDIKLEGQQQGYTLECSSSDHSGFWSVDAESKGQRWYKRSDGSHPYIIGNTMYSFLSETKKNLEPTGGNILDDAVQSAAYFNKLRFAITGDIYPHPTEKPFLDSSGKPTDNGDFGHRPNPEWFMERVDLAVKTCYDSDVIADVIMNGPDSENARSPLRAGENGGDYKPFLKYIIARYGSYPNVWLCLSNEYDIRKPKFTPGYMVQVGEVTRDLMPYNLPLSVHADQGHWHHRLNIPDDWNDHIIIQNKMKYIKNSADCNNLNYWIGDRKPVFNDELAYEGAGDGWTEGDVIEAILGAFLGGGYGSTAYKHPSSKEGHYFSGNFSAEEHTSADNLRWFRQQIDENIGFWKMEPSFATDVSYKKGFPGSRTAIFYEVSEDFRAMHAGQDAFLLGTNMAVKDIHAFLPEGNWTVTRFDAIAMEKKVIAENANGEFLFDSPDSRAVLFHFEKTKE
ncbi:DUF5060 domain-containing protein [Poritiphilus flavus]|uniref:DUF5060 domain-containing protein n=1 Tax=Poritiphilus flavus TaxID=2697053 RepID=A0A6L9E7N1_9FLAO|nr:DUF5060 domain-containing protein [Poritiphilus flavus]NAS10612.1 DUF5060 domain-containing protein [Poritiphilus flavus]